MCMVGKLNFKSYCLLYPELCYWADVMCLKNVPGPEQNLETIQAYLEILWVWFQITMIK